MGKRLPEQKQKEYPEWGMERCSEEAAAAGRRQPYHLTYIRKYGQVKPAETRENTEQGAGRG